MKRYLLFAGSAYYPIGGWHDCRGSFDSLFDAVAVCAGKELDWWHVVDTKTGSIVKSP